MPLYWSPSELPRRAALVAAAALLLAACSATPELPQPEPPPPMTALPSDSPLRGTLGQVDTDPSIRFRDFEDFSRHDRFRRHVSEALEEAGAKQARGETRYRLDLDLREVNAPTIGASMTVRLRSRLTVVDTRSQAPVFVGSYDNAYTTAWSESPSGAARRDSAFAHAARDTARDLLEDLADVGFPGEARPDGPVIQPAPRRAPIEPEPIEPEPEFEELP
ncbi:hypothetical protein M0534_12850 [Methylonatrum kenyense]|uniref:hypothetical protein n=1 Tax=Methylonatrum kenyense TaxID=455253 RepID=UPI0020C17F5A|nr:hypothetical protein [Methylonatrum kenyense]MCK8517204.1 hypothetical protein [Methylonatrum kenyense]